jgi:hypothetical protein
MHISLFIFLVIVSSLCLSLVAFAGVGYADPVFKDPNLRAELITEGLSSPTSMAFIDRFIVVDLWLLL